MTDTIHHQVYTEEEQFVAKLTYDHVLKLDLWKVIYDYADRVDFYHVQPLFKITKPIYIIDSGEVYVPGQFIQFNDRVVAVRIEYNGGL